MPPFQSPSPSFDKKKLAHIFDHDNHAKRNLFRSIVDEPLFVPRYNVSLRYEREIALDRLRRIFEAGIVSVLDFETNPMNIMTSDPSSIFSSE